jgi:N6-L-threonylcarbamoyladenine synthase
MNILAIETSCDETAISILDFQNTDKKITVKILSNIVRSQIDIHKEYGGVYPNLAKREHAKNLPIIFLENLKDSNLYSQKSSVVDESVKRTITELLTREGDLAQEILNIAEEIEKPNIDAITVTTGPGLEPALWVGINFAKALSLIWNIPVMPVNHMEGHVLSTLLDSSRTDEQELRVHEIGLPALSLLISGGHTELVLTQDMIHYEKIGETRDDAIGEAFDKTARLLGLPYPGGPKISELAHEGEKDDRITLPRPMIHTDDFDFSFSGIKTSVLYLVKKLGELNEQTKKNVAREFQEAVTEVLIAKTKRALGQFGAKTLIVGGGVSANDFIKEHLQTMVTEFFPETKLFVPDKHLSTDNSLMIGIAGYLQIKNGVAFPSIDTIKADSNLDF